MPAPNSPKRNHLLAALPAACFRRLPPHLEQVAVEPGCALYEPGSQQDFVYFPAAGIVSLQASVLKVEFERGGRLQRLLLRYTQSLIAQTAQTAACNRHHSVEQQVCRWLLLSLDRLPSNQLTMTHELIANKLGVRREGVTEAAGNLQAAGLIRYSRGRISVLDRPRLEERVCDCYAVVKRESDRLLSGRTAAVALHS
jgi:hypothetical protein